MRFPTAKVDAVELSKDAMELAKRNVADHRLKRRVRVLNGRSLCAGEGQALRPDHLQSALRATRGWRACRRNVGTSRALAFDGGADLVLIVRRLIDEASKHLNEERRAVVRNRSWARRAGTRLSEPEVLVARNRRQQRRGVLARRQSASSKIWGPLARRAGPIKLETALLSRGLLALRLHLGGVVVHQLLGDGRPA